MSRTARLRTTALRLAQTGPAHEANTAVTAYVEAIKRQSGPSRYRRAMAWYMDLPHNRYVFNPLFAWAERRPTFAVPVGLLLIGAEIGAIIAWH